MAEAPLNCTDVAPVNAEPVIVTAVPTDPLVGENELMLGGVGFVVVTVKVVELVAVPPGVVTLTGPDVAPPGTEVLIWLSEVTVKVADAPLNVKSVAPVNPEPEMITLVPTDPLDGLKELMAGAKVTVKFAELVAFPPGVVTLIAPVVAPLGTDVEICASEVIVKVAAVPLKVTAVAPVKPDPEIVTDVPTGPLGGLKELMTGGTSTVKLVVLLAVPFGVVTLIGPDDALAGTLALISLSDTTE